MGLIRFTLKSTIAGSLVYYTVQEGLWSGPEESGKIYNKLYNTISPFIKLNVPQDVMEEIHHIPNPSDLKKFTATYWNQGVVTSIKFLSELPTHVSNGIDKIQKEIEKANLTNSDLGKLTESK